MRKLITVIALGTAVTALASGTAGTAAAAPVPAAASARHLALYSWTLLNEHGPGPNPGERLTARVEARTVDGRARGHAVVQHVFDKDGTVRVEFDVDCLAVDGGGAVTATGPIESVTITPLGGQATISRPGWKPLAGLTSYPADADGERRVGWAASSYQHRDAPAVVTACTAVPAGLWIIEGGSVLRR